MERNIAIPTIHLIIHFIFMVLFFYCFYDEALLRLLTVLGIA